jgi:hypothetical protein
MDRYHPKILYSKSPLFNQTNSVHHEITGYASKSVIYRKLYKGVSGRMGYFLLRLETAEFMRKNSDVFVIDTPLFKTAGTSLRFLSYA